MSAHTVVDESYNPVVADTLAPYQRIEAWPAGKVLFREGNLPDGVYYLQCGEVDLSFSNKPLLAADPGQFLGLTCVMSGRPHDCTATTRTAVTTGFIEKNQFLRLLDEKPALWLTVLQMISSNINSCWDCMRSLSAAR